MATNMEAEAGIEPA